MLSDAAGSVEEVAVLESAFSVFPESPLDAFLPRACAGSAGVACTAPVGPSACGRTDAGTWATATFGTSAFAGAGLRPEALASLSACGILAASPATGAADSVVVIAGSMTGAGSSGAGIASPWTVAVAAPESLAVAAAVGTAAALDRSAENPLA
jgi:hypothetical protein